MTTSFVKLYGSILQSTIWLESPETKVVWITMLAMADPDGVVLGSVPGLARTAGVSVEACREALQKFQEPDPDSMTPDYEGRRIETVEGGWLLLNHTKYRDMRTRKQVLDARRQREKYERDKMKREASRTSRDLAPDTDPDPDPDPLHHHQYQDPKITLENLRGAPGAGGGGGREPQHG